jgi:uncharacterized protein (DUF362 family)/Pyruvate/2-oxoacid:ferredoxin oxidoreductase delta subunit
MESLVSIVRCSDYEERKVRKAVLQSIDLIGGIGRFVKRGDRVLLKPNLLYGKSPEKAVTTHPAVVRALVGMVRDAGGEPFIGDSPGFGSLKRAADKAGIGRVADEMNCSLFEFDQPAAPYQGRARIFKQLEIDQRVLDCDVVINLPKWKTHAQMLLTLGVKNLFGCVPGRRKPLLHLHAGENRALFAQMLLDLYRIIRPQLTVLDGIVGMEGNGPGSGDPIALGLLLASDDALSLDEVVCDLVGLPRRGLPTNRAAFENGLGKDPIRIVGESVESAKVSQFRLPDLTEPDWRLPGFLKKTLKNAFSARPEVNDERCEACRRCEEICPPKALARKGKTLFFDYGKCIRCFCCLEVCPAGAISVEQGWGLKLFSRRSHGEG